MSEREIPDGYTLEWVPDPEWELTETTRKCRGARGCDKPAVAAFRRKHRGGYCNHRWWYYCADHMYGRKIEDGVVKCERLVKIEAA